MFAVPRASAWLRRLATPLGVLGAGACLGVLALGGFGAHYVKAGYLQCHPRRARVTDSDVERAKQLLPGLRHVTFRAQDGAILHAWYAPPKNGALMVLVTGLGGNRASLLDEAGLFARHGYGSLLLDARAHGDSDGTRATWGYLEADDVVRAVKFARAQSGVKEVGALGFSVGGSAVALAAFREPQISVVVLYATWTSLREEIAFKSKRGRLAAYFTTKGYELSGVDVDAVRPEPRMKSLAPRPLLMISGGQDRDTPAWVMDRLFEASADPKEIWRLPEVGHGGYFHADPEGYERRVVGFLDRSFRLAH